MQIRVNLGTRTGIVSSLWVPADVFKALPDISTVAGGQTAGQAITTNAPVRVLQSLVPSSDNTDYHATPNCLYFNVRGQDNIYFGNWGGSFAIRSDHWGYLAHADSDVTVHVRGWDAS